MNKFILVLISLLLLSSCEGNKKINPPSTGRFNELLVVIPQKDWEGDIGTALKKVITADVMGLPQPEPQFSIIRINPDRYDGLLLRTRNILIVEKANKPVFKIETNVNAAPQVVIEIKGPDSESIISSIEKNAFKIVNSYKKSDLASLQKKPAYPPIDVSKITFLNKQGLQINIPNNYEEVDDQENFMWFRNETYNPGVDISGSMNLIAYTVPLTIPFEQIKDSLSSYRDKIGQANIPGPHENTYLITEAAYTPHVFDVKFDGLNAYKTLGKWEIKNGYMAGPFISYAIEDPAHNRIVIIEGFVYAPSVNKRDYMFELEAILGTFKINK